MKKSTEAILYILSIFPIFGVIIGIASYKKNVKFARNCIGIAIGVVIVYQILKMCR